MSREIGRMLAMVRRSTGVRGNLEAARQFLAELAGNPDLELPDPGEANVEWVEPRIEQPMVDSTQYINRQPEGADLVSVDTWPK